MIGLNDDVLICGDGAFLFLNEMFCGRRLKLLAIDADEEEEEDEMVDEEDDVEHVDREDEQEVGVVDLFAMPIMSSTLSLKSLDDELVLNRSTFLGNKTLLFTLLSAARLLKYLPHGSNIKWLLRMFTCSKSTKQRLHCVP